MKGSESLRSRAVRSGAALLALPAGRGGGGGGEVGAGRKEWAASFFLLAPTSHKVTWPKSMRSLRPLRAT